MVELLDITKAAAVPDVDGYRWRYYFGRRSLMVWEVGTVATPEGLRSMITKWYDDRGQIWYRKDIDRALKTGKVPAYALYRDKACVGV